MSKIFIKINDTDRSTLIEWASVRWEQNITNKTDSLTFRIRNIDAKTYRPDPADEVELLQGDTIEVATKIFGGNIVNIVESAEARKIMYDITVRDYSFAMDAELVARSYTGQTVAAIIEDIKDLYLPSGYTTSGVACTTVIPAIKFNYLQPSKCFQELAELTGYDWYVDENRDIHFFGKETAAAPFVLNDTIGTFERDTLKIRRSIDQIRNSIFVRGSEMLSTGIRTEDLSTQADGTNTHFQLGFRYKNYTLKVNGTPVTVGIDNVDSSGDYDAMYNFTEKVVSFATAPAGTDTVTFEGNYYIPLRIKWKNNSSISKYGGEYQFLIVDKTLTDSEAARDRAKAEVLAFAEQLNDASFTTRRDGLRTGQTIQAASTFRGIAESFTVTRITARCIDGNGGFEYSVTLANKQNTDFLDLIQRLLVAKTKEIEITDDEVLTQVEGFIEDVAWGENWTVRKYPTATPVFEETILHTEAWRTNPWGVNVLPIWVAGNYFPVSDVDRNRSTFADSGAVAY